MRRLIERYQRLGLTFVRRNGKTGVSLDLDNMCPKAEAGNQCQYCYRKGLETSKRMRPAQYHCGLALTPDLDLLRTFCEELRAIAPRLRSIRTFSLSDYRPEDHAFWVAVWRTVRSCGLRVHVVTKQYGHVPDIAPHVDCVQVSIDSLEPGNHRAALSLRRRYDNVIVRCVVLNETDHAIARKADLVTVYHGLRIRDEQGTETVTTYRSNGTSYPALCRTVQRETRKPTCCITGHCDSCGKCWYPKRLRRNA